MLGKPKLNDMKGVTNCTCAFAYAHDQGLVDVVKRRLGRDGNIERLGRLPGGLKLKLLGDLPHGTLSGHFRLGFN